MSVRGLLLRASYQIPLRTPVSLKMDVQSRLSSRPIRFTSEGEVVRVENLGASAGFAIAVQCKQPFTQMEAQVPVTN